MPQPDEIIQWATEFVQQWRPDLRFLNIRYMGGTTYLLEMCVYNYQTYETYMWMVYNWQRNLTNYIQMVAPGIQFITAGTS